MKLEGIKQVVEVDDFIEKQVNAAEVELPDTSSVSSDSHTMGTGKFTLLTPSPGSLDWGCNPSTLYDWIQKWSDYWSVNWVGGTADESQLLKLMKVNLHEEWLMALSDFDWDTQTVYELYQSMDTQLDVYWPPLKRTINLMSSLKNLSKKLTCSF